MCKNTAYNYLKKVGYTYKKTFLYQERNEKKRKELTEKIDMGHVVIHNERGRFEVIENFEAVS